MERKVNFVFIIVFVLFLTFMGASYFFLEDQTFSVNENRVLQTLPDFSFEHLLDGSYISDIESYINDQGLFRDQFMELKTSFLLLLGNKDINQVYIGKDGYLLQKVLSSDFHYEQFYKNIEFIHSFASNSQIPVSLMLVPSSYSILKDKLPEYALPINEVDLILEMKEKYQDLSFIDVFSHLEEHQDETIYYKTDHHWTTLGAYYAYQAWQEEKGIEVSMNSYQIKKVSSSFKGTLYSKVLNPNSAVDQIQLFYPKKEIPYTVMYNFNQRESTSVYDYDKLDVKDQYQVFLGGNYPEITIHTNSDNDRSILLFKDSFANSFLPFLIHDYENIYVVDLRYFNQDVSSYIEEREIDEILFLYNVTNLADDTSLKKL